MAPTPKHRATTLSRNLVEFRRRAELTQEELEELSGVHRITIANIERGQSSGARQSTLERLAKALGVRVSDLIEELDRESPIEPVIQSFLESPHGKVIQPTPEEVEWLRSLPAPLWIDLKPNPAVMLKLIEARRAQAKGSP